MDTMLFEGRCGSRHLAIRERSETGSLVPLGAPQLDARRSEKSICGQAIVPRTIYVMGIVPTIT